MPVTLAGCSVVEVRAAVAALWSELLDGRIAAADIRADDTFFALGGTSLLAMAFLSQGEARWGIELPITVLIDHRTLGELAAFVTALAASTEDGWL